jgi:hypothetical protein
MPRYSKVDLKRFEAFDLLRFLDGKIDPRTLGALQRKLGKATTILKSTNIVNELQAIKTGVQNQLAAVKQEGTTGKKKIRVSSNQVKAYSKNVVKATAQSKIKAFKKKYSVAIKNEYLGEMASRLRKIFKEYAGKYVIIKYIVDGDNIIDREDFIPTNLSNWWKNEGFQIFAKDTNETIFQAHDNQGELFIYPVDEVAPKEIFQSFLDGVSHCVFTPIRKWAVDKLNTAESKPTQYRYSGIIKKVDEYTKKYSKGVPEDAFGEICNDLQIDIHIDLPFNNKFIEIQSIKKKLKAFRFVNTRLNHLELNEIISEDTIAEVTQEELEKIKKYLDEENQFYTYRRNTTKLSSISTLTTQYRVKNEFGEAIGKFETDTGLKNCKIDDVTDFELSSFVKEGTHYNAVVDFKPFEEHQHIDQKKAYTQFRLCKYYSGFLGKITDFRQTDKIITTGLYRITNLDFSESNFADWNRKLQIYKNWNVYPSPELLFLKDIGVEFDIVEGCWGIDKFEFDFSDEMIESKTPEGVSYYAKYCGFIDSHNLEKRFNIKCSEQYFSVIKQYCGGVARYYGNGEATIAYPKQHNYHLGHITAFITAYQRLNVIEQLLEFDIDDIIRICVDGIFYTGETPELKNCFRIKPGNTNAYESEEGYCSNVCDKERFCPNAEFRKHFSKELHLGAGGCGKTHYNCNDKGLVKPLFVAPSWKLSVCKKKECGINNSVWARLVSTDPEKINYIKGFYNTLIVDEVSMMSEEEKELIFNTYSDMKIIFCGDLGFQLPSFSGDEMTTEGFDNIEYHNQDYRCQDEELNRIKRSLRHLIKMNNKTEIINNYVIEEFRKLGKVFNSEFVENNYSIEDMILSSTNTIKDTYTKLFTGKFGDKEKYYVTENNRLYNNGQIVIGEKPEKTKCEIRHCFTTHSIQGETAYYKLFIDARKMFDSRMFYTAISRAKTLSQIFIILE